MRPTTTLLCVLGLFAALMTATNSRGQAVVRTRVTGAANWNVASTWIKTLTGTIDITSGNTVVTGVGTAFNTEIVAGDVIMLASTPGTTYVVGAVQTATQLTVQVAPIVSASSAAFGKQAVPGAFDNVEIGNSALTTAAVAVTLNQTTTVGSLTFIASPQANTLTHAAAYVLTVSGDVALNQPTAVMTTAWNINAGSALVAGNVTLTGSSVTTGRISRIALTTGTLDIGINLTYNLFTGSAATLGVVDLSGGASNLKIGGSLLLSGAATGTLNPGASSTVTYDGTGAQTIGDGSSIAYCHLAVDKAAGTATLGAACSATGNVLISAGTLNCAALSLTAGGNLTNSGTLITTTGGISVAGNWTNNGTFTFGTGTVTFNGTANQVISGAASQAFYNITVNKTAGILSTSGVTTLTGRAYTQTNGDFIAPATLDLSSSLTITTDTLTAGASLLVAGNWANNGVFVHNSGTVTFNGSAQTLSGTSTTSFRNVTLSTATTLTANTNFNVASTLNVSNASAILAPAATVIINSAAPIGTLTGAGTVRISRITAPASYDGQYRFTTTTLTNLRVEYTGAGAQDVTVLPYSRLSIAGTSTKTAAGALAVSGTLLIATTATLDMATYDLTGAFATSTAGFLKTQATSALPVPAGKSWAFSVEFNAAGGGQTVPQGTYARLTNSNTSGVNTASGALSVSTALTLNAGSVLNMGVNALSGAITTVAGTGTLRTQNTTTTPISLNKVWTGPVIFDNATGGQTIVAGTYSTLTTAHTSGITSVGGSITVTGAFSSLAAGGALNAAAFTVTAGGDWMLAGTLTSTGTFTFNGAATQTVSAGGAFQNVTVNKAGGSLVLGSNVTVGGTLTFTLGKISTGSYTLSSTSGIINGAGQSTGWVAGKLQLPFSSATLTRTFSIGGSQYYSPLTLTFAAVSVAGGITASTPDGAHPSIQGSNILTAKSIPRYWSIENSGGAVFTTYTAALTWNVAENYAGITPASLVTGLYASSAWTQPTVSGTPTATTITATGIATPGDLIVGEPCAVSATINYTASPYCGSAGIATVTLTGTTGGTFSSAAGLSLNASTGAVDLAASTAGTYTVTYGIAASGGCAAFSTTASITVTEAPYATGSYPGNPYCTNGGFAFPSGSTSGGGTLTGSPAGLSLNSSNGLVNLGASAPGTYTVTLTIPASGGCPVFTSSSNITINAAPSATILYTGSPYCTNSGTASVTLSGTTGGTFTSTTGLSINASTGAVDIAASTLGTYTVTYTIGAANGCAAFSTTASIQISSIANNDIDYTNGTSGIMCSSVGEGGTATLTAPAGTQFVKVGFASYGTPSGACSTFVVNNACHATTSQTVAQSYLLGNNTGSIVANNTVFTDPCMGTPKTFSVQASYAQPICAGSTPGTIIGTTPTGGNGTYTYAWQSSTTSAVSGFATAPGTANAKDYTPGALSQTTWFRRVVTSGGCSSTSVVVLVKVTPATTASISYTGSPYCSSSGTAAVTQTGTTGGTYSSTAGLSINPATGAIAPSSSTPGTYVVTYTVGATGGCPVFTTTATVTITAAPGATISYAGSPYCSTVGTAVVTRTGTAGGTYSSTAGLSINSTTGDITLASSTTGTYTVTYTVAAAGGCGTLTTTAGVTVTAAPTATINYAGSPYCASSGTATVTQTGTGGGTYSGTTGLVINATTGAVTLGSSTAGMHTVTYTVPALGGCPVFSTTANIVITAQPAATGGYANPAYCTNGGYAIPYGSSNATGTLSATPAGIYIDANFTNNGVINLGASAPGAYTVIYTVPAGGGCAQYTNSWPITINAAPTATISYAGTPYCSSGGTATVTQTGTAGGTYSSTSGLSINATTGAVSLGASTAGTYTVTYTIPAAGGCAQVTATTSITITAAPAATISYSGSPFCSSSGTVNVTLAGTAGGTFSGTSGLVISATTGAVTLGTSTAGTHTVTYTVAASNGCAAFSTTTSLTVTAAPSATIAYTASPYCITGGTAAVTRTGTAGGTYSSAAGLSVSSTTGAITLASSTAGTYTVTYTVAAANGCAALSTTAGVTVTAAPSATIAYASAPYCTSSGTASVTQTGTTGGTYSSTTGLSINATTGLVNPSASTAGTYTVTYTVAASGGCAQYTTSNSITINAAPTGTIAYSGSPYCTNVGTATVTQTGTTGGTFSSTAGLSLTASTGVVNLAASTPGTYTVTYTVAAANGCAAFTTTATIQISTVTNNDITSTPQTICAGTSPASIIGTTPTGGNGSYTYLWEWSTTSASSGFAVAPGTNNTKDYTSGTLSQTSWFRRTVTSGGCSSTCTAVQVTVTPLPNASISYTGSPYCGTVSSAAVTQSGSAGGTYSSTTGLSINATTGLVNPSASTAGTYTVTYTVPASGGCATYTTTASISIVAPNSAAISYLSSPYCSNGGTAAVTMTGTTGGTFSSTTGLSINATTGAINLSASTPGTYTVTYSMAAGTCPAATTTGNVTITAMPSATITYAGSPYCAGAAAVTLTGTTGGTYSSTTGLSLNASTGAVDVSASTPGTYTVTYTVGSANGCAAILTTASISINTILANDVSYVNGTSGTLCGTANEGSSVPLTAPAGTHFVKVGFASYGTPNGTCGAFTLGACHASTSQTVAQSYLLGLNSATIPATNGAFTDPCPGTGKRLYVQASYAQPICAGTVPGTIVGSTPTGGNATYAYLWEQSTTSATAGFATAVGTANAKDYTPGALAQTTWYRRTVTSGGCSSTSVVVLILVTPQPAASITYTGTPYCASAGTINVVQTGTTGGTYSSTTGLSINATTGAVNAAATTPGTYTVTYTVASSGGCAALTTTASITVTAPGSAAISYSGSPFCTNGGTASVSQTGTTGGIYSSTTGLSINATTGAINLGASTPGSYTVTYSIAAAGGCSLFSTTASVAVTAAPSATISYTGTPYCANGGTAVVTQTGSTGGAYSSAAGLSINTTTGTISLGASTPGTYTVTYTVPAAGGCAQYTTTTSVVVTPTPNATISYAGSPYCSNGGTASVTQTGTTGGTYSSGAGLSINTTTGAINLGASTPGTYTVTYSVAAAGGCSSFSATTGVTITTAPSATISYAGSPYCSNGGTAGGTQTGTTGGAYSSTTGLSINATTGAITLGASTAGTYTVTYTVAAANGCAQYITTASVTVTAAPSAMISYAGSPYCTSSGTATVTRTGTNGGTYSSTTGLSINSTSGAITLASSTPGTYTVTYTVAAANGCASFSTTTSVTVTAAPSATIAYTGTPYCSNGGTASVTRTGTSGGTYSSTTGLTINATTGAITLASSTAGTYTVTYTVAASGGCALYTTTTSITITAAPSATISYAGSPYCSTGGTASVTRTGTTGGTYSSTTGLSISSTSGAITLSSSTAGTYTVTYTVAAANGCTAFSTTASVTVTAAPSATITYTGSPYCGACGTASVTRTGTASGTYTASPAGLSINASTGAITLASSTAGTYTVTYTVAASGGCAAFTTTASVVIHNNYTWTGATSTAWTTAGNWSPAAVPLATASVTIPSAVPNYPLISSGTVSIKDVAIISPAAVTISGAGIFRVAGAITGTGKLTASAGTVELNGTAAQTLAGTAFTGGVVKNLTANNTAGVTLTNALGASGIVKATTGNLASGGYLTLLSSSAGTALIDGSGAGNVTGAVHMQRYLPTGFGYKYLSSPFSNATVAELADDINLSESFPTLYYNNENLTSAGWTADTAAASSLVVGRGYAANFGLLSAPDTFDMIGTVNNGPVSFLNLYNHNHPYTQGFNLVGNPYPSPIDWNSVSGWSKTAMDNAVYFFNAGTTDRYTGSYSSYINGVSSNGVATNIIAAMQGFFVHVSNGSYPVAASMTVNNAARVNNLTAHYHKTTGNDLPMVRLGVSYDDISAERDDAVVYFEPAARTAFDAGLDALKLLNTDVRVPNLYSQSADGQKLSIAAMPAPGDSIRYVPLGIEVSKAGSVMMKAVTLENLPMDLNVFLADRMTGIAQNIRTQPEYRAQLDSGVHNARFFLVFTTEASVNLPRGNEELLAYTHGSDLFVFTTSGGDLTLTNTLGQVVLRQSFTGTGFHRIPVQAATGLYIATLTSATQRQAKKVFIGEGR